MTKSPNIFADPNASKPLLLTQQQCASLLGVHRTTIWRLAQIGVLVPVEVAPGMIRYQRGDVELLASHGYKHLIQFRRKAA